MIQLGGNVQSVVTQLPNFWSNFVDNRTHPHILPNVCHAQTSGKVKLALLPHYLVK